MKKVQIEVTPRMEDGEYHACLKYNTACWDQGHSIEEAVCKFIHTHLNSIHVAFRHLRIINFTSKSMRLNLKALVEYLKQNNVELEITFLPDVCR